MQEIIEPLLSYEETCFAAGGPNGCRHAVEEWVLYECLGRDFLLFPAGTVPRIAANLEQQGFEVRVRDRRRFDGLAFEVNHDLLGRVDPIEQQVLHAVLKEPLGLIAVSSGQQRDRFILRICQFFSKAKFLIPVATVRQAHELQNVLSHGLGGNVQAARGRTWHSSRRIVICTYESFETVDNQDDWDIIIFPDAEDAITRRPAETRGRFQTQRVYAFAQPQPRQQYSRRSQLRLETLAGPVIFALFRDADPSAHVRVVVANSPLGAARGTTNALERKRRLCWHNDRRNDVVAEVASGFGRGEIEILWSHGLLLAEDRLPVVHGGPYRVTVLVESPEHGRQLRQRLPEWRLLHAEPNPNVGRPGRQNDLPWGLLPDRAIITAVRAHQLKALNVDILIMAAGGDGSLVPPGYSPRSNGDPGREVLLVDFCDDLDRRARKETQRRLRAYADRGFRVEAPARWGSPVEMMK